MGAILDAEPRARAFLASSEDGGSVFGVIVGQIAKARAARLLRYLKLIGEHEGNPRWAQEIDYMRAFIEAETEVG